MIHTKISSLFSHGTSKKIFLFSFLALVFVGVIFGAWNIYAQNSPIGELKGIGWSAQNNKGIGWVVLNSEDAKGLSSISFAVSVKNRANDKGTLDGQGWASIKNPKTGEDSYGWLSFDVNKITGCPSGDCKAILDYTTGAISGWARFICVAGECATDSILGNWDGFVSLRNTEDNVKYGLCLGKIGTQKQTFPVDTPEGTKALTYITGETCVWDGKDNEVNGIAWAGNYIGGWIVFGNSVPDATFGISPAPAFLFPKEKIVFSAESEALWFVNNIQNGNASVGTITPPNTQVKNVTYQAPNTGGPYTIKASSTQSTASTTATIKFPYTFSCEPTGTSTITLRWAWSKSPVDSEYLNYAPHTISVARTSPSSKTIYNEGASWEHTPWSVEDSGLATSTNYSYKLEIKYGVDNYTVSTQVSGCNIPTAIPSTDVPSKLKAFATDVSTIYINWKDNTTTTKPYVFNLQRMKLTPASSTEIKVDASKKVTDSSISLSWKNNTTSTPYYNLVERSTSTSNRFLDNPPPNDTQNDKAMVKIKYSGSTSPFEAPKTFSYSDNGLQEATTYYYRVKACSTYEGGSLTEAYENDRINGITQKPNPVCGKYAPSPDKEGQPGVIGAVATTTLPKTPSQATSTASYNTSSGVHSITIRWNDNSKRETGYYIWRDGILIHKMTTPFGTTSTLTHVDNGSNNSEIKTSLAPGTNYGYEIRAYYDIPAVNGGGRVFSDPTWTDTYTYYRVTATVDGSGTIEGPGSIGSCSSECTAYFPWYTTPTVQVSAIESDPDFDFSHWQGVTCKEGNTSQTCTFNRGNSSVRGVFRQVIFTLSMDVSGPGTVTGSGINCGDGKMQCSTKVGEGSPVALSASPSSASSTFSGWSLGGPCTGINPSCSFNMPSSDVNEGASFTLKVGESIEERPFFAELWSNAKYLWKGLFVDNSSKNIPNLSASFSSIVEGVRDGWDTLKVVFSEAMKQAEEAAIKMAKEQARVAESQSSGNPLDVYFKSIATTTVSSYVDKNLEEDTVYLYRVRAIYEDGSERITEWSNSGATKTMRDTGGGSVTKRGVCTRNSYCDFSVNSYTSSNDPNAVVKIEGTEQQCQTNIDCKEVGRYGQAFQER